MARSAGLAIKAIQWFARALEFCCAAIVLGFYSYFLATLHNHGLGINNNVRAVEGLAGAACLYTLIGLLLLCFIGGYGFFAFIAIILDILFIGAFAYIAYENRVGDSCSGVVNTVFGTGDTNSDNTVSAPNGGVTILPSYRTACRFQSACFGVAIAACLLFAISTLLEFAMWRHHRSEKKYGPSPSNGYTAGSSRRRFWQRGNRHTHRDEAALAAGAGGIAAEKHHHNRNADTLPVHETPAGMRTSYQTDNTMVGNGPEPLAYNKYGHVGNGGVGDGYAAPTAGYPNTTTGHHMTGVTGGSEMPAQTYATTGTATNY